MINFQVAEFIKSAFSTPDHLYDYDQILFIGKSNVGKSSLINALTNKTKLAYVSKTPGQTKLVNYYLIDHKFYLVDAPGFGYRRLAYERDDFDRMMDEYLVDNPRLKLVCYLLDSRREISQDEIDVIKYVESLGYKIVIIFTKCDKLNQSEKAKMRNSSRLLAVDGCMFSSIKDQKMLSRIREELSTYIE